MLLDGGVDSRRHIHSIAMLDLQRMMRMDIG